MLSSIWAMIDTVSRYGSDEIFNTVLEDMRKGAGGAWCYTEPGGGSDLAALKTKAAKTEKGWVLNGQKRFITNGSWADWYCVLARLDEERMSVFLVHRDDPGVSFGALEKKMGFRGSPTCDVILENCEIGSDRLMGEEGSGWDIAISTLVESRTHVASQGLGIAQAALDEAVAYTKERVAFGRPVANFQMVRGMLADMAIKVESSRALLHKALELMHTKPEQAASQAAMAKVLCTDTAMSVAVDAVQLHGGYGYLQDYPVERIMRDAKITQIWEGTNQIQRMIIAKDLIGHSSRG